MELYSNKPPHIAPTRFAASAPEISSLYFSDTENTNPEKKIGQVSVIRVSMRPIEVDGKPPLAAIIKPGSSTFSVVHCGGDVEFTDGEVEHGD